MSDFDKEAEREKLREQFAEDERERESTQRMSELLLQGATMTNKHCDVHGAPMFRQNGEEFCPSCQTEGRQTQATTETDPSEAPPDTVDRHDDRPTPADPSAVATDSRPPAEGDGQRPDASSTAEESSLDLSPEDIAGTNWEADVAQRAPTPSSEASRESRTGGAHTDLSEARASLARTVTRFTNEAERTDDLARAREYLAAVEDAADALAAVRNAEK